MDDRFVHTLREIHRAEHQIDGALDMRLKSIFAPDLQQMTRQIEQISGSMESWRT